MGLADDMDSEILEMIDQDFGETLEVDGSPVEGIFRPDYSAAGAAHSGNLDGSIVERFRLVVPIAALNAVVGHEVVVNGKTWTIVSANPRPLVSDVIVDRYLL